MKFGDYLREQRNNKGWTQPEAADHCGIEQSYLSKLENGKAYPSEEVFEKLRSAYDLNLAEICESVADPELEKMREVTAVRGALNARVQMGLKTHRRSLLLGAFLIVLGSGLLAYWVWIDRSDVPINYVYESKGVVLEGESPYLFNTMPSSRDLAHMEGPAYDHYFLSESQIRWQSEQGRINDSDRVVFENRLVLRDRLDYDRQEFGNHRGDMFIADVSGGSRTYTLLEQRSKRPDFDKAAYFILGIMSVIAGILSFFVGARWR